MAAARTTDSHAHLWARFARSSWFNSGRSLQYRIVHFGFWSSIIFLVLMILDLFAPGMLQPHYVFIAVVYLLFQLAEITTRDALNWGQVLESYGFTLVPAIYALVVKAFYFFGHPILSPEGSQVMNLWFWMAWITFGFSVAIGQKIPSTGFRREESPTPRP